jgi:hypothetical protein
MHPVYVASQLSIVPLEMREYLKDCLTWIEVYMGIEQAALFAKVNFFSSLRYKLGCSFALVTEHPSRPRRSTPSISLVAAWLSGQGSWVSVLCLNPFCDL